MPTDHPTPSPAPASGAETTYCAQCVLNGSGRFPMRDGDCTNPRCVLYMRHLVARPSWLALPTPPSDAGTSERETCPDCPHAPHLGTPCAECRRFGGFRGECSHQGAKGRPAAPAAEGPRDEAWWLAIVDREGDMPFGVGVAPTPSLAEWHRRVAACASRATVKRTGEEWPACDCGLSLLMLAAALPGAEAGTPKGESGTAERTRWMAETEAGRADTIERCKYASDGPSHLITAFARHCTALTSEVARLTEERDAARDAMVRYSDYYDREVEHNTALIAERRALTSEVRALTVRAESAESALDEAWGAAIEVSDEVSTSGAWESKGTQTYAIGAARWLSIAKKIHALRYALAARLASPSPTGAP